MNCTIARELLDERNSSGLAARDERELNRHLDHCESCEEVAFTPLGLNRVRKDLPLDDHDFDRMRRSVMESIERDNRRRLLWLRPTLGATAALIVLVISSLVLVDLRPSDDGSRPPSVERVTAEPTTALPTTETPREPMAPERSRVAAIPATRHDAAPSEPPSPASPSEIEEPVFVAETSLESLTPSEEGRGDEPAAERQSRPVRIELQTSDPTIRIIWIAADESAPDRGAVNQSTSNV